MYGGLFDDLPPTKKDAAAKSNEQGNQKKHREDTVSVKKVTDKPATVPLASAVGIPTPVFTPAAARRRNQKRSAATTLKLNNSKFSRETPTVASVSGFSTQYKAVQPVQEQQQKNIDEGNLHGEVKGVSISVNDSAQVEMSSSEASSRVKSSPQHEQAHQPGSSASTTGEGERRRRMQQDAENDPYDPMVPNDLLEYWEWRKTEQSLAEQRERLQAIEQQQQTKEAFVDTAVSRGRGRGGVSNLPAWMVQQQREQREH